MKIWQYWRIVPPFVLPFVLADDSKVLAFLGELHSRTVAQNVFSFLLQTESEKERKYETLGSYDDPQLWLTRFAHFIRATRGVTHRSHSQELKGQQSC